MAPSPSRPSPVRVQAFVDGQNLFYAVRNHFGYAFPNYDVKKLAEAVTSMEGDRVLSKVHFYTGLHARAEEPFWHEFWSKKMLAMQHAGVEVVHRRLKYADITVPLPGGGTKVIRRGREKGIDIRLALDLVRLARRKEYDTAIIFSQDTDLQEAVEEAYEIRRELGTWLKIECAFPSGGSGQKPRGISKTQWRVIDKATYDLCIDPTDYRPSRSTPPPTP